MILLRALLMFLLLVICLGLKNSHVRSILAGALTGSFCHLQTVYATEIRDQIKVIQALQVEKQIDSVYQQKRLMQQSSTDSEVFARGIIALPPPVGSGIDASQYPLGFSKAGMLDSCFDDEKASLIITAVPRNGSPFAAKIIRDLPSKSFPLAFTISSEDLLFPYTKEAWDSSQYSKDDIAITAVLDEDGHLETPGENTRFGFAIAQVVRSQKSRDVPIVETKDNTLNSGAGVGEGATYTTSAKTGKLVVEQRDTPSDNAYATQGKTTKPMRREARISISLKADRGGIGSQYKQEEIDLLRSLDRQLSSR